MSSNTPHKLTPKQVEDYTKHLEQLNFILEDAMCPPPEGDSKEVPDSTSSWACVQKSQSGFRSIIAKTEQILLECRNKITGDNNEVPDCTSSLASTKAPAPTPMELLCCHNHSDVTRDPFPALRYDIKQLPRHPALSMWGPPPADPVEAKKWIDEKSLLADYVHPRDRLWEGEAMEARDHPPAHVANGQFAGYAVKDIEHNGNSYYMLQGVSSRSQDEQALYTMKEIERVSNSESANSTPNLRELSRESQRLVVEGFSRVRPVSEQGENKESAPSNVCELVGSDGVVCYGMAATPGKLTQEQRDEYIANLKKCGDCLSPEEEAPPSPLAPYHGVPAVDPVLMFQVSPEEQQERNSVMQYMTLVSNIERYHHPSTLYCIPPPEHGPRKSDALSRVGWVDHDNQQESVEKESQQTKHE